MNISELLQRALRLEWLSPEEGVFLFENASTTELMFVGNAIRQHHVPGKTATWTEIQFFRIKDGKVAEHWVDVDLFGWFTQLGVIPPMGG